MKINEPIRVNINLKMRGPKACFIVAKNPQSIMEYFTKESPNRVGEVLELSRLGMKNKSEEFGEVSTPFGKKKIEYLYWVETEKIEKL
jgi:hypothetical protein